MRVRLLLLFSACLLFGLSAKAQTAADTTVKHAITEIYTEKNLLPYNIWQTKPYTVVDTTIDRLEFYTTHYYLGNPGLPTVPVIFNSNPQPLGFFYGYDHITDYMKTDTSIHYYKTRAPYLNFYYVTDPMIHQFLDLSITQNFGKKLNVGVEFHRFRSEGDYSAQGSNDNQLNLSLNYRSKRYMMLFDAIYDIYKEEQNGGLKADSDFTNSLYTGYRQTVPVYLTNARSIFVKTELRLQQYYFFGYSSADTAYDKPLFYISHTSSIGGNSNVYSDPTLQEDSANFYPDYFKSPYITYDSLRFSEFSNDITIGSGKGWNYIFKWDAGVKQQWVHFRDWSFTQHSADPTDTSRDMYRDTVVSNLMAHARIYNTYLNGHILFDASGSDIFSGTQKGDKQFSADLGFKLDSLRLLKLSGNYSYQTPAFVYEVYDGNNFEWMNHFNKVTTTTESAQYTDAWWHLLLSASVTQIQNLAYFTTTGLPNDATPTQFNGILHVLQVNIKKDFTLGKWHLNTKEIYQNTATSSPIHLPKWVTENSVFYENYLFHHHLLLRVGVDIFCNSSYYVYGYQPVFNQYYTQNQTKLGNYPYLDPFVAFRVKTFRMFLKYENVGAGLIQPNVFYGYVLNYPMPDGVLRFGISWDFWN